MDIVFTRHALSRIESRNILEQEVSDGIKNPDRTEKRHGLYYIRKKLERGTIEICLEKTEKYLNIITVYWL
jgi:hypothetical protein